jgi:hypothetical protein
MVDGRAIVAPGPVSSTRGSMRAPFPSRRRRNQRALNQGLGSYFDVVVGNRPVLAVLPGLGVGAALLAAVASPAARSGSFVDDLLQRQMRFSAAELRALDAGSAVIRSLGTPVRQELANFGVVYVDASADRFVERFRDIERFESGPGILQIGRFGSPPRLEDLASLTLPAKDVMALARCRPGNCDVKLPAAAMSRFRDQVNWSSADAARQANDIAREMILEVVRAYQRGGNVALGSYDDGSEPLSVAGEFRALLTSGNQWPVPVPGLLAYLDDYPNGRSAAAEDFFYWSVVDFGFKPTIRVNHVIIQPLAASPSGVAYVIAIKQLYASHYFHTTLELRFLVDDARRAGEPGSYLISVTRSRSDGMTGLKGLLLRPIISRRSRDAVRGYLEHVKRQVQRPARAVTADERPVAPRTPRTSPNHS